MHLLESGLWLFLCYSCRTALMTETAWRAEPPVFAVWPSKKKYANPSCLEPQQSKEGEKHLPSSGVWRAKGQSDQLEKWPGYGGRTENNWDREIPHPDTKYTEPLGLKDMDYVRPWGWAVALAPASSTTRSSPDQTPAPHCPVPGQRARCRLWAWLLADLIWISPSPEHTFLSQCVRVFYNRHMKRCSISLIIR